MSSLYILDISPLSDEKLEKLSSHSVDSLITLVSDSFAVQKLLNLMQS
jgi:hypothetical protein